MTATKFTTRPSTVQPMTETRRRGAVAPWLVGGVAAVVAIVLAVGLVVYHLPSRHGRVHAPVAGALSGREQQAMQAASQEVVNLLTYARKTFNADFQRALSGMSGSLQSDQAKDKAATLAAMNKGKFDLKGQVTQTAFEQSDGKNAVLVLVSATGYQIPASGTPTPTTYARFEITMTDVKGAWLATNLSSVGLT
jgi:hypothetical protein